MTARNNLNPIGNRITLPVGKKRIDLEVYCFFSGSVSVKPVGIFFCKAISQQEFFKFMVQLQISVVIVQAQFGFIGYFFYYTLLPRFCECPARDSNFNVISERSNAGN